MTAALSDLVTVYTRDQVLESLLTIAETLGLKARSWRVGSIARTLMVIFAQAISDYTAIQSVAIGGGFLDFAYGIWLTALALYVYNVKRITATFAAGDVTITNGGTSSIVTAAIGDFKVGKGSTGKTYTVQAILNIPPAGSATVAILADVSGADSSAGPSEVDTVVTPVPGAACNNALSVLGNDAETDPDLRTRCRNKLGSLSPNGPAEAYAYVATTKEFSPTSIPITRTKVEKPGGNGTVNVYCATSIGTPSGPDLAIVQTAFDTFAEPQGIIATALGANPNTINVGADVYISNSSLTDAQISQAINTQLATWFSTVPIGGVIKASPPGFVYLNALRDQIFKSNIGTQDVVMNYPLTDSPMFADDVPIFGGLTINVFRI